MVLDLEATAAIDVPSCDSLRELAEDLRAASIVLSLARVHYPVADMLERSGVMEVLGGGRIFPRVLEAIADHVERTSSEVDAEFVLAATRAELEVLARQLPEEHDRLQAAIDALQEDGR